MMKKGNLRQWQWYVFDEIGSTNDEAVKLSSAANGKGFIVTTETQTNGRGRIGRSWISLQGNLFVSMGFEYDIRYNGALVFIVSLALLQTIKKIQPDMDAVFKWPNDVLVNGKKVSGILLEKGHGNYIIAGIGVNITSSPDDADLIYPATNLKDAGINIDKMAFLNLYLEQFDEVFLIWSKQGCRGIVEVWQEYARGLNQNIVVHTVKGSKSGIFVGIDNDCRLLLKTEIGLEIITAGDVFFEEIL
jgi:BirA family biotin operon repressor/biotin-[acetyl-CoA-carboxylase] ligase